MGKTQLRKLGGDLGGKGVIFSGTPQDNRKDTRSPIIWKDDFRNGRVTWRRKLNRAKKPPLGRVAQRGETRQRLGRGGEGVVGRDRGVCSTKREKTPTGAFEMKLSN